METKQKSENSSERLNRLYKEYGLLKEDYYHNPGQGFTIITRTGVDKIESKLNGLNLTLEIVHKTDDLRYVVVKAVAVLGDKKIETFGETNPLNYKEKQTRKGDTVPTYPVAMAEKRARSRAILRLSGFYELRHFDEDESPEFKREELPILEQGTEEWESVVMKIQAGTDTIDSLSKYYFIPETLKYKLMDL